MPIKFYSEQFTKVSRWVIYAPKNNEPKNTPFVIKDVEAKGFADACNSYNATSAEIIRKLLQQRSDLKDKYGSYLATSVFYPEKQQIQRITNILNKRYKIL